MAQPEKLFWQQIRKNLTAFSWIRLESRVNHGIPDVLGATKDGIYFTTELKVTKSNRVNLSPHQIAYHEERKNSCAFILVKRLLESNPRKSQLHIYGAEQVRELADHGLKVPGLFAFDPINWSLVQKQLVILVRGRTKDQLIG